MVSTTARLLAIGLTAAFALPAAETFGWRGDGTGVYPEADPPIVFGEDRNLAWKTPLPNWANGSPSIGGGHVYVLCEPTIEVPAPRLICLDRTDGAILWQRELGLFDCYDEPELRKRWRAAQARRRRGYAAVLEMQELYRRADAGEDVAARIAELTAEAEAIGVTIERGKPVRRGPDKGKVTAMGKGGSFPRDLMKQLRERYGVCGFNWEPGKSNIGQYGGWKSCWTGQTFCAPATDARHVYAYVGRNVIGCYTHAGDERWKVHVKPPETKGKVGEQHWASSIYVVGDRLLCYGYHTVFVLDKVNGRELWRQSVVMGKESGVDGRNYTACVPVTVGDETYGLVVWDDVYLFDLVDGRNVLAGQRDLGKLVNGTPGVLDDVICFESRTGPKGMRAYRLVPDGNDGVTAELLWAGTLGIKGKPVRNGLHHGVSILGHAGRFWFGASLDARTGAWDRRLSITRTHISPIAAGNRIYSGCDDGRFFVYDARSGDRLAENRLALPPASGERQRRIRGDAAFDDWPHFSLATPIADGPELYIRAMDYLYCFRRAETGLPGDDQAAVEALRKARAADQAARHLSSDSVQMRYEAARRLSELGLDDVDATARRQLRTLATDDPQAAVRAAAIRALDTQEGQPGSALLKQGITTVKRGGYHIVEDIAPVLTVRQLGPAADPALIAMLQSGNADERRAVAVTITAAGERRSDTVRDALLAQLGDATAKGDRRLMPRVIAALGYCWGRDATIAECYHASLLAATTAVDGQMLRCLIAWRPDEERPALLLEMAGTSPNDRLRALALQVLDDHLPEDQVFPVLAERFEADEAHRVRRAILDEIGALADGDDRALAWLEERARAGDGRAVYHLGRLQDGERAQPVLTRLLDSERASHVAQVACTMIARDLTPLRAVVRLEAVVPELEGRAVEDLVRHHLGNLGRAKNAEARSRCATLLATLLAREDAPAFERWRVAEVLGTLGADAAHVLDDLRALETGTDERHAKALAAAIGTIEKASVKQ